MNTVQLLALGAGAYFLYVHFYGDGTTAGSGGNNSGDSGNGADSGTTPSIAQQIKAAGMADVNAIDGKLNFWEWNYFYEQITGNAGIDPFTLPQFQGKSVEYVQAAANELTFEEWLALQPSSAGLGYISQWWMLDSYGRGQSQEVGTGFERSIRRLVQ